MQFCAPVNQWQKEIFHCLSLHRLLMSHHLVLTIPLVIMQMFSISQKPGITDYTLAGQFFCTKPSLIHSQAFPSGLGELQRTAGLMAVSRNVDVASVLAAVRLSAQTDIAPHCQRTKTLMVLYHSSCCKDLVMSKKTYTFPRQGALLTCVVFQKLQLLR